MNTDLFYRAAFATAGRTEHTVQVSFFYEEGQLIGQLLCPVQYEAVFEPMLRTNGGVRVRDNGEGDMQPTTIIYRVHLEAMALRAAIEMYRGLMMRYVSALGPVGYEYATHYDTADGIKFIEVKRQPFVVEAALECPDDVITPWCRTATKSGLVASITPGHGAGVFDLTLAHDAHRDDRRLATYEALASSFNTLMRGRHR